MFVAGDALTTMVMERYALEREHWVRSADAVRSATVQELLAGTTADVDAASRRLRYELRQPHEAFVVWAHAAAAAPDAAAAAVGGERALLLPLGVGLIAGWAPAGMLRPKAAAGAAAVAIGTPAAGSDGFRTSHYEAMEARRVARLTGAGPAPVRYDDVALIALLTADLEQARAFAARRLGALCGNDETARRLADTLHVVLEEQGSPRRAARRLGVHETRSPSACGRSTSCWAKGRAGGPPSCSRRSRCCWRPGRRRNRVNVAHRALARNAGRSPVWSDDRAGLRPRPTCRGDARTPRAPTRRRAAPRAPRAARARARRALPADTGGRERRSAA